MITSIILGGGKGERFWPKSRLKMPKQFLKINGSKTMIQQTICRLKKLMLLENIFVVTNEDYVDIVHRQLPDLPTRNLIVEPMWKNTAACIGLTALRIEKLYKDSIMIIVPSDHAIKNDEIYIKIVKSAIEKAETGNYIITIGIRPSRPETGYGYIKFIKDTYDIVNNYPIYKADKFVEKPDYDTAVNYVKSQDYLWNSGIYVCKTSTVFNSISKYMPKLNNALNVIRKYMDTDKINQILYNEYSKLDNLSIDYGIMEKADNIYVIPGDFGWEDVGTWAAIDRIYKKDQDDNVIKGNVLNVDTKDSIIIGDKKLIATLGIKDIIIVDTKDALLICSKNKSQDIKKILDQMKNTKAEYL